MNTKKIAEEAWNNIATEYDLLSVRSETGIAIIQTVIEKARKDGYTEGYTDWLCHIASEK